MLESIIFFIIFNDFLAIIHLLSIIDAFIISGEHGSVLDLLHAYHARGPGFDALSELMNSVLICKKKVEVSANSLIQQ